MSNTKKNAANRFYGNKNTLVDGGGYFCGVQFNPVATGEQIRARRLKNQLTIEGFVEALSKAGLLNVSVTTLGKWERGRVKRLDIEQIEALCIFFECSHNELVVYRDREIGTEHDQLGPFFMNMVFR